MPQSIPWLCLRIVQVLHQVLVLQVEALDRFSPRPGPRASSVPEHLLGRGPDGFLSGKN